MTSPEDTLLFLDSAAATWSTVVFTPFYTIINIHVMPIMLRYVTVI